MKKIKILLSVLLTVFTVSILTSSQAYASYNESDMRQAQQFIASLPAACSGSFITTKEDGTVVIYLNCQKGNDRENGRIEIKDGVVNKIK